MKRSIALFVTLLAVSLFLAQTRLSAEEKVAGTAPLDILAKYVYEAKFGDFPPQAVTRAKYLILDNIGCALGATQTDIGKNYLKLAHTLGGGQEARVIGSGEQVSCLAAAYVNAQLANVLDFDDTYDLYLPGHPGNAIVHTALALSDAQGASGQDMLAAVILGYEVCLRAGKAAGNIDWQQPFLYDVMSLGTITPAAHLLRLDLPGIRTALLHADLTPLPFAKREKFDLLPTVNVTDLKNNAGYYAMAGIMAAHRADQGLAGWGNILSGDLKTWFLSGGDPARYQLLTQGLGKDYLLLEVSFKPTPSCRLSHPAVTALWQALGNQPVKSDEVKEIIVKQVKRLDRPTWDRMLQAQFSLQCIVAMAALGVEPGPQWYITQRFNDPDVKGLAAKVKLEDDPQGEEMEITEGKGRCSVKVVFTDGTVKEAVIRAIKGAPDNPMSEKELQDKFRANTRALFSESRLNRIIDLLLNLEKLPRVSTLTALLTSPTLKSRQPR